MIKKFIAKIEQADFSFSKAIAIIASTLVLRVLLESASANNYSPYQPASILHLSIFFITLLLALIIITRLISKVDIRQVSKFFIFGFPLILSAPIVDLLISGGSGFKMTYMFTDWQKLLFNFITFFGKEFNPGITWGMRTQIFLAMLAVAWYIFLKTEKIGKSLAGFFSAYVIAFLAGALPSLFVFITHPNHWWANRADIIDTLFMPKKIFALNFTDAEKLFDAEMAVILIPILVLALIIWYGLANKVSLASLLGNMRPLRLLFQIVTLCAGIYLGVLVSGQNLDLSPIAWLFTVVLIISAISAWLFSVVVNDLYDVGIDKITNRHRPLVEEKIPVNEYKNIGVVALAISLLSAAAIGYPFFLLMAGVNALCYVYSVPPLRLRRFPFVPAIIMALAALFICLTGFALYSENGNFTDFPKSILALNLIVFSLILNAKDIKDREGDAQNGVVTIPTLFGERGGKLVIGALIFLSFTLFAIFLQNFLLFVGSVGFGLAGFFLAYDRKAKEQYIFALYSLYVIFVLISSF
ncbi:MAG: hypothetical protein ACD_68C00044G0002 [uncultured bacterium]|nr:MAG: hypothetical protein ACD_68C00044G0002 [uncultured bacterium]